MYCINIVIFRNKKSLEQNKLEKLKDNYYLVIITLGILSKV